MIDKYFLSQQNIKDKYFWIFVTYIVSFVGFFAPAICTWNEKISNFKRVIGVSTIANHDISKVISNYYIYLVLIGLVFVSSLYIVNLIRTKFSYTDNPDSWKIFNYVLVIGICINLFSIFNVSLGIKWIYPNVICLLILLAELFFIRKQTKIDQETALQLQKHEMNFVNQLPPSLVVNGNRSLLYPHIQSFVAVAHRPTC